MKEFWKISLTFNKKIKVGKHQINESHCCIIIAMLVVSKTEI